MRNLILFILLLPLALLVLILAAGLSFIGQLILLPHKVMWHIRDYDLKQQHKLLYPEKYKEPK